jgi:NIPSNAP
MVTLSIRYTFNPNQLQDFKTYVAAEQEPVRRSGGKILGYFFPTDLAGRTNEALGLIDLPNVAAYEQYRNALANDPDHKKNAARLEQTGAVLAMNRSIIQRMDGSNH